MPPTSSISTNLMDMVVEEDFDDNDLSELLLKETTIKTEEMDMTVEENYEENEEETYVKDTTGWGASPLLPPGWMFKQEEEEELSFLSKEGTLLSRDEVEMLFKYKPKKMGKSRNTNEVLPEGWMGISDPLGKDVKHRQDRQMKTKIKPLTKELQIKHKWTTSEFLPEGWLGKQIENTIKGKKNGSRFYFLDKTGFKFVCFKSAAAYMRNHEIYTEEDVNKLYLFPDGIDRRLKT